MRLDFVGKTNKDYCMVNKAYFKVPGGLVWGIDRMRTEYTVKNGNLDMEWRECYIWEVNGNNPYEDERDALEGVELFEDTIIGALKKGKLLYLELEDDADEDYKIDNIEWAVG